MQAAEAVREFPRIYIEVPVRISSPSDGGVFKALLTRQLGQGGCMLVSDDYFGSGRILTLYLRLGNTEICAISQVLYEHPDNGSFLSGIKFLDIHEEDKLILTDFMGKALTKMPEAE